MKNTKKSKELPKNKLLGTEVKQLFKMNNRITVGKTKAPRMGLVKQYYNQYCPIESLNFLHIQKNDNFIPSIKSTRMFPKPIRPSPTKQDIHDRCW